MRVNNTCRQHLHHCVFSLAPNRSDKLKGVRVKIHTALSHFNTTELFRKSLALSMMAKANNKHFLSVVAVLISFAFGEGKSIFDFQLVFNAIYIWFALIAVFDLLRQLRTITQKQTFVQLSYRCLI